MEARRESAADKFTRKVRQYRGRIAVSAVLLLLCAVCGVLAYHLWQAEKTAGETERRVDIENATKEKERKLDSVLLTRVEDATQVLWKKGAGPPGRISTFCMTPDRLTLYFDTLGKPGDILRARRTGIRRPFGDVQALPPPVNSEFAEWLPTLSPDERWLYFTSNRDGMFEIFAATRTAPGNPAGEMWGARTTREPAQ